MENKDLLEEAIVCWINKVSSHNVESLLDLKDGHLLKEILLMIENNFFITLLKNFKNSSQQEDQLKNLSLLHVSILDYIKKVLRKQSGTNINIPAIFSHNDKTQILSLIGLIITIILQTPQNIYFIEAIMNLSEAHQIIMKEFIESLNCFNLYENLTSPRGQETPIIFSSSKEKKLLEKLDEIEEENCNLLKKLRVYEENTLRAERNYTELKEEYAKKIKEFEEYKLQVTNIKTEFVNMYEEQNTSSKVFYEKKIKELNYIIERQARDYELRISNLEESLNEEANIRQVREKAIESLERYKMEHMNLNQKAKEFSRENDSLKNRIEESSKKIEITDLKIRKYQEKISELENALCNQELDTVRLSAEVSKLTQQKENLQIRLNKKDEQINDLMTKLEHFSFDQGSRITTPEKNNLKNELECLLNEDNNDFYEKGNTSYTNQQDIEFLQTQNKILATKLKEIHTINNNLQSEIKKYQNANYEELIRKNEILANELKNLKKSFKEQGNKGLAYEKKRISEENKILKQEKNELEKKLLLGMRLDDKADELEKENIFLKENLFAQEEHMNEMETKIDQIEKENKNKENELQTEIEFLRDINEQVQRTKEEEIKLLITTCYHLKNNLKNAQMIVSVGESTLKTNEFIIPKKTSNLLRERSLNVQ